MQQGEINPLKTPIGLAFIIGIVLVLLIYLSAYAGGAVTCAAANGTYTGFNCVGINKIYVCENIQSKLYRLPSDPALLKTNDNL